MDIETFRDFCLSFSHVKEELPFDENTLVFKVGGKLFALTNLANPDSFNVKCDPEKAIELRERYESVIAGYHMNKKHWNTIYFEGELTDQQLKHWIQHSYDLVFSKLSKKIKLALEEEEE